MNHSDNTSDESATEDICIATENKYIREKNEVSADHQETNNRDTDNDLDHDSLLDISPDITPGQRFNNSSSLSELKNAKTISSSTESLSKWPNSNRRSARIHSK